MARIPLDFPLTVADLSPAEQAEWDRHDDRVTCVQCLNRSGTRCEALAKPHPPLDLKHRCAHYRTRRRA